MTITTWANKLILDISYVWSVTGIENFKIAQWLFVNVDLIIFRNCYGSFNLLLRYSKVVAQKWGMI